MLTVASKQRDEAERIAKVMALAYTSCPQCQAAYRRGRFYRPYFICPCCGRRWSQNRVIDALGGWLSKLHEQYPWDWFATLTFANERFTPGSTVSRGDITPDGAAYWFRHWLHDAGDVGGAQPYAFRADEYGPLHGRYHLHALIGNVAHLQHYCGEKLPKGEWGKSCCWLHRWPCGFARIVLYDPRLGAHYYLSKYVIKAIANWDVIGFDPEDHPVFKSPELRQYQPVLPLEGVAKSKLSAPLSPPIDSRPGFRTHAKPPQLPLLYSPENRIGDSESMIADIYRSEVTRGKGRYREFFPFREDENN